MNIYELQKTLDIAQAELRRIQHIRETRPWWRKPFSSNYINTGNALTRIDQALEEMHPDEIGWFPFPAVITASHVNVEFKSGVFYVSPAGEGEKNPLEEKYKIALQALQSINNHRESNMQTRYISGQALMEIKKMEQ